MQEYLKITRTYCSLGNPHLTDIFSREGELIATVAAHFRWFHFAESSYKPLFDIKDIMTIMQYSKLIGASTENQQRACEILKSIKEDSLLYKAISFILSGISIQMLKYTTLNGFPRKLNEIYQTDGYFDVFDPEYVAFVIETTQLLFNNYDHLIKVLLHVTMWIENYLVGVAQDVEKGSLTVDLEKAEKLDNCDQFTRLASNKIQWMRDNIGFEVVRYPVGA